MAATQIYSNLFDSNGLPLGNAIKHSTSGAWINMGTKTVPTTSQDEANDTVHFVPVASGTEIYGLHVESGDQDSGTQADFDIVLLDPDGAIGATALATLWNSGSAFQSAVSKYISLGTKVRVPLTDKGYALVSQRVNTAAQTPAEQTVTVTVFGT